MYGSKDMNRDGRVRAVTTELEAVLLFSYQPLAYGPLCIQVSDLHRNNGKRHSDVISLSTREFTGARERRLEVTEEDGVVADSVSCLAGLVVCWWKRFLRFADFHGVGVGSCRILSNIGWSKTYMMTVSSRVFKFINFVTESMHYSSYGYNQ